MTSMVTQATTEFVADHTFVERFTTLGLVMVALLVVLFVTHQFLHAAMRPRLPARLAVLDIAIWPLLIAFALMTIFRILGFVYPAIER